MATAILVMLVCACESKTPAPVADKQVYRWRGKDGSLHFTDDPKSIPQGAKVELTEGAEIKVVAATRIDAGNLANVGTEESWRTRFGQTTKRISELEAKIAQDKRIVGDAENNEMLQEALANDVQFENAMIRITASRSELKRQQDALENLHSVADGVNVPPSWRK